MPNSVFMVLLSYFNDSEMSLFVLFGVIVIGFLIIDLGLLNRNPHKISFKSALYQSIFWVLVSLAFGVIIYLYDGGSVPAFEYLSAYLTEKALSIDNIFVIILILKYFKVDDRYYHKVLFYGILGALVFRAVFIFLGAYLVGQFHWILYIFGAFLLYSGFKLIFDKGDEDFDPEDSPVVKYSRKFLNITQGDRGSNFAVFENGKLFFTPLFLVVILIETTDLIFAVDSIPAAFAITQNEFIIYTSNIFAVLGLRAMFFLLSGILDRFYLLQKGLSMILIFIGGKMLVEIIDVHVPIFMSFAVIVLSIAVSMILSVMIPNPKNLAEVEKEVV
jgi:tellurite resistance protein TerC